MFPDNNENSPNSRRQSLGSTIADLLNNYTSDIESLIGSDVDSELQQLDWSDWEDDFQEDQVAPQDIQNYYELLKDIESLALPQTSSEEGCHKSVWPENQLHSLPARDEFEEEEDEGRVTVLPSEDLNTKTPLAVRSPGSHKTPFYGSPAGGVYGSPYSSHQLPASYTASPVLQPVQTPSRAAVRRNISRCIQGEISQSPKSEGLPQTSVARKSATLSPHEGSFGSPLEVSHSLPNQQQESATLESPSRAGLATLSPTIENVKGLGDTILTPPLAISSPFGPSLEGAKKGDIYSLGQEAAKVKLATRITGLAASDHSSLASLLSRNSDEGGPPTSRDCPTQSSFSPSLLSENQDDSAYKSAQVFSSFDDLSATPNFFMNPPTTVPSQLPRKSLGAIPKDRSSRTCHSSSSEEARSSAGGNKSRQLSGQRYNSTPDQNPLDKLQTSSSKRRLADFWEKSVLAGMSEEAGGADAG